MSAPATTACSTTPDGTLVVTDGDGHAVGGCAERPGQLGWGFSGAEETAGHELGHMYGRKHVAGCDDPGTRRY